MRRSRRSMPRRARRRQRQLELALQRARFEAAHAHRQYDAVDPTNRLVAGELERRGNEALQVVHRIEGEIAAIEAKKPVPLGEMERQQLMQLGTDLALAWSPTGTCGSPTSGSRTRLHAFTHGTSCPSLHRRT